MSGEQSRVPWSAVHPRGVPRTYPVPSVGLDRLLDDAAHDFPGGAAVSHRGRRLQWRQLQDLTDRLAAGLEHRGGGRLLLALPPTPQAVVAMFAAWRIGAAVVLASPAASDDELADLARESRARICVLPEDRSDVDAVHAVVPHRLVTGAEDALPFPANVAAMARRRIRDRTTRRAAPETQRLMDVVRAHAPLSAPSAGPPDADDIAAVFDCDGRPVSFTHGQLVHAAFQLRLWLPDTVAGAERVLGLVPPHLPFGLTSTVTAPVLSAATLLLEPATTPRRFGRVIGRHDPTVVVLDDPDRLSLLDDVETPSLRVCLQPGPCDQSARTRTEAATGSRVRGWWAPPDSAGMVLADPIYGLTKPGTVGIPVTDTAVAVRSAAGGTVTDQPGSLWVDGPQLPAAGWQDTGVAASMDADGFVTLLDATQPPAPSAAAQEEADRWTAAPAE